MRDPISLGEEDPFSLGEEGSSKPRDPMIVGEKDQFSLGVEGPSKPKTGRIPNQPRRGGSIPLTVRGFVQSGKV
jgi:hypothetical protein